MVRAPVFQVLQTTPARPEHADPPRPPAPNQPHPGLPRPPPPCSAPTWSPKVTLESTMHGSYASYFAKLLFLVKLKGHLFVKLKLPSLLLPPLT